MNRSIGISWLVAMSLAAVSATAVAQNRGAVQGEAFIIDIDVFSGRPNPRLVLEDPAEVRAFAQKVKESCDQASPVAAAAAPGYPATLGYRGLSVSRTLDGSAAAFSFAVAGGSMRMAKQQAPLACQPRTSGLAADAAGDLHLLGAGPGLEAYVAELAFRKGAITQPVYQAILQRLSAP